MIWLMLLAFGPQEGPMKMIPLTQAWEHELDKHEVFRSRALAASDSDRVAVIDRDDQRVVLLSEDGEEATVLGTKGQGPGEIMTPLEITWSQKEQNFVIVDNGNSRLSLWDGEGNFVEEKPLPFPRGSLSPIIRDDQIYMVRNAFGLAQDPAIMRAKIGKKKGKEFFVFQKDQEIEHTQADVDSAPVTVFFRWDPILSYGIGSDFIAWTWGERNRVSLLNMKGKPLVKSIEVKLPRVPVTDKQIEEGIELMPNPLHDSLRKNMVKPDSWPHIRSLVVDDEDRIWVIGSARDVKASHPFRVFTREGKLLGRGYIYHVPNYVGNGAFYFIDEKKDKLWAVKVVPRFDA